MTIIICLIKSEVPVERISVCKIIEKLAEYGIHCLQCSGTCYCNHKEFGLLSNDVIEASFCHVLSTTVDNSIVAIEIDHLLLERGMAYSVCHAPLAL